jgi:dihydroorotate dehydrogenase (fumarate)
MSGPNPPPLNIHPPLLNSANPWATSLEDLQALYDCASTGAVTTRTSLLGGFAHDPTKHRYLFFNPGDQSTFTEDSTSPAGHENASLNTLGYSPIPLNEYLGFISSIAGQQPKQPPASSSAPSGKPFIISVTGGPDAVTTCYETIATAQASVPVPLAMEINLSCPNIPGAPPPAYSEPALTGYIMAVASRLPGLTRIPFGIKTPPYTHADEYSGLISALLGSAAADPSGTTPISFITATNTLGSCLVLDGTGSQAALPGAGIGGLAGAPLHPLALGNVATLRRLLDEHPAELGHVQIIGVGGVSDAAGYRRMKAVGAAAVGVGTALGLKGVKVFDEIAEHLGGAW